MVSQLDPDLPVETGLSICIVLTRDPLDIAGANVSGLGDLVGNGVRPAPEEEIDKRDLDAVFLARNLVQLNDSWRRVHGGVESHATGIERERLPVIQNKTRLPISVDVGAKAVG